MEIKLQDFARDCGVTDRAIHKHIQKYNKEIAGHITRRGQNGTWLDDEAQKIIKSKMKYAPIVLSDTNQAEEVERLRAENNALKDSLLSAKDQILELSSKMAQISLLEADNEKKDKLIEEKEKAILVASDELQSVKEELSEIKTSGFFKRLKGWKN